MSRERSQEISIRIHQKLSRLSRTSNEHCIFKVHNELRSHNVKAYEPRVVSIGPYHHHNCNLNKMETYKLKYLQELLVRKSQSNADEYIDAITKLEERARRCYAEEVRLSEDEFVEMLCLDGLFVIEFLRKYVMPQLRNGDDKIFQMGWLLYNVLRDLILFENQIPFFIIVKLFDMTKFPDQDENLIHLALSLCNFMEGYGPTESFATQISADGVTHLLDLVHKSWCSSFAGKLTEFNDSSVDFSLENIKSTTELQQSGIKFEGTMQSKSWLHITFENGKIKIPCLTIEDGTESIFRNLLAYEEYMCNGRKCVSDYTVFMDLLIDSPKDVEKLRRQQIIRNGLGDDEAVCRMFNKLSNDIGRDDLQFCYIRVFQEVNKYSSKRRNIWRAHLMRNYFNNPWSIISFLAAVVLLILTLLQTIYSIL